MRLKITLICLALAAVLVVGCGSSGSSSSGSGAKESSTATTTGDTSSSSSTSGDSSGDSSGSEAASGKPLTKAEFIAKGDAICAKVPPEYSKLIKALEAEAKEDKKPKPTEAEKNAKAAVPPLYVAVASLEELTPPKGEEQKTEAIVAALESAAKGLEQKPESELSGTKSPFAEFQKLTSAYGFKSCNLL